MKYADRANKPLLISLLNLVLPEGVHVHDIVKYRDREQERDTVYSKKTTLDLVCEDDDGNIFSVEVQRETGDVFFQRCVYYAAGHYHGELMERDFYDKLHPVYLIAFLEGKFPHEDNSQWDSDNVVSEYSFIEKRTKEFAPATIFVTFVELGRFKKKESECVIERDKLFYWFKHSYKFDASPRCAADDPQMQSLVEATRIAAFTPEKKNIYNLEIMNEKDREYLEKLKVEAAERTKTLELAAKMKTKCMSVADIVEITGLTAEQVEAL